MSRTLKRFVHAAVLVLLPLLAAGCGGGVRHYAVQDLGVTRPFRLAVLPLTNLASDEAATEALGFAIVQEILARGDYVVAPHELVNEQLAELRIRYADRMSADQVTELGHRLGVDGLLVGVLDTYEYRRQDGMDVPLVSLHLRLIGVAGDRVLWAADHQRAGTDHEFLLGYGLARSLAQLGQQTVREMIATMPPGSGGKR